MSVSPTNFGLQGFAFPRVSGSTCDYPAVTDVRAGVSYDSGNEIGTLTLPPVGDVLAGYQYGADGTEFTGTLQVFAGSSTGTAFSPADIVRYLLIQLGLGGNSPSVAWPCYASAEPSVPDNVITIYDTDGLDEGRVMKGGELQGAYGVQVRIRAVDHNTGWIKADAIRTALAETVYENTVTVVPKSYLVSNMARIGKVLVLGKDSPNTRRSLFTINAVVNLKVLL